MSTITSSTLLNQTQNQTESGLDRQELFESTDDFLQIFIQQLKNQNPLEPMKSTDFIDSISRLASVEQSVNQSAHLEELKNLIKQQTGDLTSGIGYLNNLIEYASDIVTLEGGVTGFYYELPQDVEVETVEVRIEGIDGTLAYSGTGLTQTGVKHKFGWDGKDEFGQQLNDGLYKVTVTAIPKGDGATPIAIDTSAIGVVTGVESQADGSNLLIIGNSTGTDAMVPQDSVLSVSVPVQTQQTSDAEQSDNFEELLEQLISQNF